MCGWAHCHDEGASCGCAEVPVFFFAHFLSGVCELMNYLAVFFMDEFFNIFNISWPFAGAWSS
jgi:hypothetical protein